MTPSRQGGFALLIVLLTMGLLALLAAWISSTGRVDIRTGQALAEADRLRAAAEGAIAHAAFAVFAEGDPKYRPGLPPHRIDVGGVPVLVRIQNEGDRVNLNTASVPLLQSLMIGVGAPPPQAARIAAAIVDWRTSGRLPRPNGAKAPQYRAAGLPYGPPEAPFLSIDELRFVLGMTPRLLQALAPHLTVWTDSDPDMSTQDPVVAQALADAAQAEEVVSAGDQASDVLRITAQASGPGGGRIVLTEVVEDDLREQPPRLRILFRDHCDSRAVMRFGSCD